MNKRRIIVMLSIMAMATGALALGKQTLFRVKSQAPVAQTTPPAALPRDGIVTPEQAGQPGGEGAAQAQAEGIPTHVIYGLLFREVAAFKEKAAELERQGQDATALRVYHRDKARLSAQQGDALEQVAAECQRAVTGLDIAAKKIVDAERARHPFGRLRRGEVLPAPPAALSRLEQQRTDTILQARARLHDAFGDEEFERLEDFLKRDAAERIKPFPRAPHQIRSPQNGNRH